MIDRNYGLGRCPDCAAQGTAGLECTHCGAMIPGSLAGGVKMYVADRPVSSPVASDARVNGGGVVLAAKPIRGCEAQAQINARPPEGPDDE
jgi:hypothetical protein